MKAIALLVLTITSLNSFAQIEFKEFKFNYKYSSMSISCNAEEASLTIPYLLPDTNNSIIEKVNEAISVIIQNNFQSLLENPVINLEFLKGDKDCDTTNLSFQVPEKSTMEYSISQNLNNFSSFTIVVTQSPSGAGLGKMSYGIYSYNIDLKNNQLITINDIFNTANKTKLYSLLKKKLKEDIMEDTNLQFDEFNISDKTLIIHCIADYDTYFKVELPFESVQKLVNKKHLWIFKH